MDFTGKLTKRVFKKRLKTVRKIVLTYKDEYIAYGCVLLVNGKEYSTMTPDDYIDTMCSISDDMFVGNFFVYITNPLLWDIMVQLDKNKITFQDVLEEVECFSEKDYEIYYKYLEKVQKRSN